MYNDIEEVIDEIDFPWLIFQLKSNMYTVNSKWITSIVIKPEDVTFVPSVEEYIVGLIHLRGNVVPLIDLQKLFKIESNELDANVNKMVIVLEKENTFAGLIVDEVLSVEDIKAFEETEEIKKICREGFVKGVAKGSKSEDVLLIIDEEKIMSLA